MHFKQDHLNKKELALLYSLKCLIDIQIKWKLS